jgi:hypothetical protein
MEAVAEMEVTTIWEEYGILLGKQHVMLRVLRKKFGNVEPRVTEILDRFSSDQFDELADVILDLKTPADLDAWLKAHIQPANS